MTVNAVGFWVVTKIGAVARPLGRAFYSGHSALPDGRATAPNEALTACCLLFAPEAASIIRPYRARFCNGVLMLGMLLFLHLEATSSPDPYLHTRATEARAGARSSSFQRRPRKRKPDVIYYVTPPETVDEMLRIAGIGKDDVLYDLGSGDGRLPIAAAQRYGIRAVGIEIDPKLITEAEENARKANVSSLVSFRNDDMFTVKLHEATVVTLYLSEKLNVLLRPKLLRELRPGARIVSHDFRMGNWKPEQTVRVQWGKGHRTVYLWIVPAHRQYQKRNR